MRARQGGGAVHVLRPVALAALCLLGSSALAQNDAPAPNAVRNLPQGIHTANPLAPEQQELIDIYAREWSRRLLDPQTPDEGVKQAKNMLLEPLGFPGSTAFREAYTRAVAKGLADVAQNDRLIARLNAMIVLDRLDTSPEVVALLIEGLQDESAAVRYWAVKAVRSPSGAIAPAEQRSLANQLGQMLTGETQTVVLEQVYQALVDLDQSGQHLNTVIQALKSRVRAHQGKPNLAFRAEYAGLRAAYQKLLLLATNRPMDDQFRQIGATAAQYLQLIARQAGDANMTPDLLDSYKAMAGLCASILDEVARRLGSSAPLPRSIASDIQAGNWAAVAAGAQQYRDMLTSPPINLPPADLVTVE